MGRVRDIWDRNVELQRQVETIETERKRLAAQQTQATSEIQNLHRQIEKLRREGMWLQQ